MSPDSTDGLCTIGRLSRSEAPGMRSTQSFHQSECRLAPRSGARAAIRKGKAARTGWGQTPSGLRVSFGPSGSAKGTDSFCSASGVSSGVRKGLHPRDGKADNIGRRIERSTLPASNRSRRQR